MPAPARRCGRAANWAWALTASAVAIVLASLCAAPRARAQTVCNPEYTGGPRTHPIDVDLIGGRQRAVEGAVTLAGDPLPAGLVADRAVLLDVYHAMWGTSWQCCLDWTTEPDPCKWVDGMVMCATDPSSGEPRVTQLSLRYRGVGGTIPASIGGLSELTVLDLTGNGVGGTLPPSIGNLTKLVVLDMTSNGLQGQLPDTFGRMSQLNYFSMLWNSLSGTFPPSLTECTELQSIYLSANSLSGTLPDTFSGMKKLQYLDLSKQADPYLWGSWSQWTGLSGPIPDSIGDLEALVDLELSYNNFSSYPPTIGKLANLETLLLNGNPNMTGTLPDMSAMTHLREVFLHKSSASGSIPETIAAARGSLRVFVAYNASLSGSFPSAFGGMPHLECLWVHNNMELAGELPANFGTPSLLDVRMYRTRVGGTLPATMGRMTNLLRLYLNHTQVGGTLGEWVSGWRNLTALDLSFTRVAGQLPEALGSLTMLSTLIINVADLSGTIPASVGNLTLLTHLELAYNRLTGPIPDSVGNLTQLIDLELNNNQLTTLPETLGNLQQVEMLTLNSNNISSTIPRSIGDLPATIEVLFLHRNQLTGTIPPEIANVRASYIYLHSNKLVGDLPKSMANMPWLCEFNVANNMLGPDLPAVLMDMYQWRYETTCGYRGVYFTWYGVSVNLAYNNISGTLPADIDRMARRVGTLALRGNQISGSLPPAMGNTTLTAFDLAYNRLSGTIPDTLGWQALNGGAYDRPAAIDFRGNDFEGGIPVKSLQRLHQHLLDFRISDNPKMRVTLPEVVAALKGTQVAHLELAGLNLTGAVPDDIVDLQLAVVDLSRNALTSMPSSGAAAAWNVTQLNVSHNGALDSSGSGLPEALLGRPMLGALDATACGFAGSIPERLSPALAFLGLSQNRLSSTVPALVGSLPMLHTLELDDNELEGSLPPDWSNAARLTNAFFSGNRGLTGTVPPTLVDRPLLRALDLSNCGVNGGLPEAWGGALEYVAMANNRLSGTFPAALLQAPLLEHLVLAHNNLTGPLGVAALPPRMLTLDVASNRLSGTLPALAVNTTSFIVTRNHFSGSFNVPASGPGSQWLHVRRITASLNRLSGALPDVEAPLLSQRGSQVDVLAGNYWDCPGPTGPPWTSDAEIEGFSCFGWSSLASSGLVLATGASLLAAALRARRADPKSTSVASRLRADVGGAVTGRRGRGPSATQASATFGMVEENSAYAGYRPPSSSEKSGGSKDARLVAGAAGSAGAAGDVDEAAAPKQIEYALHDADPEGGDVGGDERGLLRGGGDSEWTTDADTDRTGHRRGNRLGARHPESAAMPERDGGARGDEGGKVVLHVSTEGAKWWAIGFSFVSVGLSALYALSPSIMAPRPLLLRFTLALVGDDGTGTSVAFGWGITIAVACAQLSLLWWWYEHRKAQFRRQWVDWQPTPSMDMMSDSQTPMTTGKSAKDKLHDAAATKTVRADQNGPTWVGRLGALVVFGVTLALCASPNVLYVAFAHDVPAGWPRRLLKLGLAFSKAILNTVILRGAAAVAAGFLTRVPASNLLERERSGFALADDDNDDARVAVRRSRNRSLLMMTIVMRHLNSIVFPVVATLVFSPACFGLRFEQQPAAVVVEVPQCVEWISECTVRWDNAYRPSCGTYCGDNGGVCKASCNTRSGYVDVLRETVVTYPKHLSRGCPAAFIELYTPVFIMTMLVQGLLLNAVRVARRSSKARRCNRKLCGRWLTGYRCSRWLLNLIDPRAATLARLYARLYNLLDMTLVLGVLDARIAAAGVFSLVCHTIAAAKMPVSLARGDHVGGLPLAAIIITLVVYAGLTTAFLVGGTLWPVGEVAEPAKAGALVLVVGLCGVAVAESMARSAGSAKRRRLYVRVEGGSAMSGMRLRAEHDGPGQARGGGHRRVGYSGGAATAAGDSEDGLRTALLDGRRAGGGAAASGESELERGSSRSWSGSSSESDSGGARGGDSRRAPP